MVDPLSVEEISLGIERVVNDLELREELIRRGITRARVYSWDATADDVWKLFASVI